MEKALLRAFSANLVGRRRRPTDGGLRFSCGMPAAFMARLLAAIAALRVDAWFHAWNHGLAKIRTVMMDTLHALSVKSNDFFLIMLFL
jgi:hypothetical protein